MVDSDPLVATGDREPIAAPGPPFLELRGLAKAFGVVRALDGVDLVVRGGEVHALVGENSAGKSTLIAIAAGVHQPDRGEIVLRGTPVRFGGPADAEANGISVVYQELSLIGDLDVAQNIYLHREPRRGRVFLDPGRLYTQCGGLLERLGVHVDPRARVSALSVAQRQLVEIAKALSREAALVFMDEPTASLTAVEQEYLFTVIDRLRASGTAVVYVSHRLDEIFRIADVVTVLKDGRLVRTMPAAATNHHEMVSLMVGRELADDLYPARSAAQAREGAPRLRVRGATSPGRIEDISLDVWPGEIVGLAGLIGSGRTSLLHTIFGLDDESRRSVMVDDVPVGRSPGAAIGAGIGLVPEDRASDGLALDLTNLANLVSTTLPTRLGFYQGGVGRATAAQAATQTGLAAGALELRSGALSGGNQQKVVMGKWLATEPRVLLCDEPTRGIDVGARRRSTPCCAGWPMPGWQSSCRGSELPE